MNIEITEKHKSALEFCLKKSFRNNILFISGKPGVGKSVLISYLYNQLKKEKIKVVKAAPTGAAATNIKGQTIHSLFGININIHNPFYVNISSYLKELLNRIDVFIIDEISMVRADLLDEIDTKLKIATGNNLPFGGKKIIMAGDLFQIDPVLVKDDEFIFYQKFQYKTKYFFSSKVMQENKFKVLILDKIYRQDDIELKNILNNIRLGINTEKSLEYLNSKAYGSNGELGKIDREVTITTLNNVAQKINDEKLNQLEGELYEIKATKDSDFKHKILTPEVLKIKINSQVMITSNNHNKGYSNGDICKVLKIGHNIIYVERKVDNKVFSIEKEIFKTVKNKLSGNTIIEETAGQFKQFPLTLGWAFSIHKSQGMTIGSLAIDLDKKGAFSPGQLYVALSRIITINHCNETNHGLSLIRPIKPDDIIVNQDAIDFYENLTEEQYLT